MGMEFKRISNYNINIRHTINGGVIVKVGCAELSFSSPADMMDVMEQYYEDPEGMERLYNDSGANEDVPQEVESSGPEERRSSTSTGPLTEAGSGGNTLARSPRGPRSNPVATEEGPNDRRG